MYPFWLTHTHRDDMLTWIYGWWWWWGVPLGLGVCECVRETYPVVYLYVTSFIYFLYFYFSSFFCVFGGKVVAQGNKSYGTEIFPLLGEHLKTHNFTLSTNQGAAILSECATHVCPLPSIPVPVNLISQFLFALSSYLNSQDMFYISQETFELYISFLNSDHLPKSYHVLS